MNVVLVNQQLDARLAADGVISSELYLRLAEAHGYGAVSTVGWVEARLRVLARRVESGAPLTLYTPEGPQPILCLSVAELHLWVSENFPDVRLKDA